MTTAAYRTLIDTLYGASPYAEALSQGGSATPSGWGADSPVFAKLIEAIRPTLIVEVGTWLGASAVRMAGLLAEHKIDGTIVCIDTWLGSPEHWLDAEARAALDLQGGYPTLYHQFMANVAAAGCSDVIVPIPQTGDGGARILARLGLVPDLVYIDGAHDAISVYSDISALWPLLRPGGVMFGDDYLGDWMGVVTAVNRFADKLARKPQIVGEKWILQKDAA
jgi:predicted O-methyltransferase YrrM